MWTGSVLELFVAVGDVVLFDGGSARGEVESIACFATAAALGAEPLKGLPTVRSTDDLKSAFIQVGGPRTGIGVYDVKIQ